MLVVFLAWGAAVQRPIPGAYGRFIRLTKADFAGVPSFRNSDRLVMTEYFYWYDAPSKSHVVDGDGTDALTEHPPTLDGFSYKSVAWHMRQLEDMIAAGIDVVLPVFWGAPSEQDPKAELHWSYEGLPPLVQAREELLKEGKKPPRIGLFYDTSTLQHNSWHVHADLREPYGRDWFYATIRDFFSMIPPQHWAMVEGKPIVLLYSAAFAKGHDQSAVDHLNQRFAQDFAGKVPYLVREASWNLKTDGVYAWGGALGLKNRGIASVGPGYDHSAVPGREPLIVPREDGKFYERNWLKFLRRPTPFVVVETWNEFHEGTEVCETKEFGRKYIGLTRKFVDMFKAGVKPPPVQGLYSNAREISIALGTNEVAKGLHRIEHEDGRTVADSAGRKTVPNRFGVNFMYFGVDESFRPAEPTDFELEIRYFDGGPGRLALQYDGSDPNAPFGGAYTSALPDVALTGDKQWKTALFRLPKAVFGGSENSGADLRLDVSTPRFVLGRLALRRP